MKVHHITVSLFSSHEAATSQKALLKVFLPPEAEIDEKILEPEIEGGVFTKEIVEYRARLTKQADIRAFASKVLGGMDDYDRRQLRENLGDHVDDDCNLYLRLSKEEAACGKIVFESKDSIHVTIKLAAYPANRDNTLKSAKEFLDEML